MRGPREPSFMPEQKKAKPHVRRRRRSGRDRLGVAEMALAPSVVVVGERGAMVGVVGVLTCWSIVAAVDAVAEPLVSVSGDLDVCVGDIDSSCTPRGSAAGSEATIASLLTLLLTYQAKRFREENSALIIYISEMSILSL